MHSVILLFTSGATVRKFEREPNSQNEAHSPSNTLSQQLSVPVCI